MNCKWRVSKYLKVKFILQGQRRTKLLTFDYILVKGHHFISLHQKNGQSCNNLCRTSKSFGLRKVFLKRSSSSVSVKQSSLEKKDSICKSNHFLQQLPDVGNNFLFPRRKCSDLNFYIFTQSTEFVFLQAF